MKINFKRSLLVSIIFVLVIMLSLFLSGCGGPESCDTNPVEGCGCEFKGDCPTKTCFDSVCTDGACKFKPQLDCCGNGLKEDGENYCNCPNDFATEKCEGKIQVDEIRGKAIMSEVLEYMCNPEEECVLDYGEDVVKEVPLVYEINPRDFKLEGKVYYNHPFDVDSDKIRLEFALKDSAIDLVLPIKITGIKLKQGEKLLGSITETKSFATVGSTATFYLPLDYQLDTVEQKITPTIVVDYDYVKKRGEEILPTARSSHEKRFATAMLLVETGQPMELEK